MTTNNTPNMETFDLPGTGNFQYSGVGINDLGAMEYTLCTIVRDLSDSLGGYEDALCDCTRKTVKAMQQSPRAENLMVRVVDFSSGIGVRELHGFKLLRSIDPDRDYVAPATNGITNLFDATYASVAATIGYAKTLMDQDFLCNGIVVVLTDGMDNKSYTATPGSIAALIQSTKKNEVEIESLLSILVGFNLQSGGAKQALERFRDEAKFDQFVDAGTMTEATVAKLAGFISSSITNVSVSLGHGPSQPLNANF